MSNLIQAIAADLKKAEEEVVEFFDSLAHHTHKKLANGETVVLPGIVTLHTLPPGHQPVVDKQPITGLPIAQRTGNTVVGEVHAEANNAAEHGDPEAVGIQLTAKQQAAAGVVIENGVVHKIIEDQGVGVNDLEVGEIEYHPPIDAAAGANPNHAQHPSHGNAVDNQKPVTPKSKGG